MKCIAIAEEMFYGRCFSNPLPMFAAVSKLPNASPESEQCSLVASLRRLGTGRNHAPECYVKSMTILHRLYFVVYSLLCGVQAKQE